MNIEKALSENMGRQVKIGFGSSFVYCDTVTKETFDVIESLSNEYLEKMKSILKTSKSRIKSLIAKGEENFIQENISKNLQEGDKVHHDWDWWECEYYRKIGCIANHIDRLKRSIEMFCPFLEAKVYETYPSIDEDAIIIISKANPCVVGEYWTCDEYRRGIKTGEGMAYE